MVKIMVDINVNIHWSTSTWFLMDNIYIQLWLISIKWINDSFILVNYGYIPVT